MKMMAYTPMAFLQLQTQASLMAMEAGAVIWMRMMGMAGVWSVLPSENARMVTEKQRAFAQAATAMVRGTVSGQDVDKTLSQELRPIRRTTKSNVSRLMKRGPKRK